MEWKACHRYMPERPNACPCRWHQKVIDKNFGLIWNNLDPAWRTNFAMSAQFLQDSE